MGNCSCFAGATGAPAKKSSKDVLDAQPKFTVKIRHKKEKQNYTIDSLGELPASPTWTREQLQEAVWEKTMCHPTCQTLKVGKKKMAKGQIIADIHVLENVPSEVEFELAVDKDFPQKLGPFTAIAVQFDAPEIILPPVPERSKASGFTWQYKMPATKCQGLRARTTLSVKASPISEVNVGDEQRRAFKIPKAAKDFAWSYPAQGMGGVDNAEDEDAGKKSAFLLVGGYMYFDAAGELVGTTTLGGGDAVLQFGKPQKWTSDWTRPLVEQGRFQEVTLEPLLDSGVRHFCWLHPGEKIKLSSGAPVATQPSVPQGGFAYLFQDDPTSEHDMKNCYFALKAMSLAEATKYRSKSVKVTRKSDFKTFIVGESFGEELSVDWTYGKLQDAIWHAAKCHPRSQTLSYEGRVMTTEDTIESLTGISDDSQLPAELNITLDVDKGGFPEKLGPFKIVSVPLEKDTFVVDAKQDACTTQGFAWTMTRDSLKKYGLRAEGPMIMGDLSPVSVCDSKDDKKSLHLHMMPASAKQYAWSYPTDKWDDNIQGSIKGEVDERKQSNMSLFLTVGGFMYYDAEGSVAALATIALDNSREDDLMYFNNPRKWLPEWTKALHNEGRLNKITLQALWDVGARYFCWLRPGEVLNDPNGKPFSSQPTIDNGGFMYLFHDDPLSTSRTEMAWNCYFPMKTLLLKNRAGSTWG